MPVFAGKINGKRIEANRPTRCTARVYPICLYYAIMAYICNVVPEERRGREDPVQYPGPLLGGLHPEYLYPRYTGNDAGSGGYDGECYRRSDMI